MWKGRKELPDLKKLNLKFDIKQLREAVAELEGKDWNACIGGALNDLREVYGYRLSKIAYKKDNNEIKMDDDWKQYSYQQLALTEFNPDYEIRDDRNSGSRWDKSFMRRDKKYDERAYNKPINDLPEYLGHVFKTFGKHLTRVNLAKLMPGEQVAPHIDYDATFSTRYHIAIDTNPKAKLCGQHLPADGHVWFLNPGKLHSAENEGDSPRTHLILNMDSQDLLYAYS